MDPTPVTASGVAASGEIRTRLEPERYLQHLETESARFREAIEATDRADIVPSCPEWTADDLLWHLTCVQRHWALVVQQRPAGPEELEGADEPPRPADRTALLNEFDHWSAELLDVLSAAPVTDEAWNWSPDHTVGFILRRQAHEALIHRLDAELTAGTPTALDPNLAADGVDEVLTVMYGGSPEWGTKTPTTSFLRVDCTDTDDQIWVNLVRFTGTAPDGTSYDEDDIAVVSAPGHEPDAVVQATAAELDAWLWHRLNDDAVTTTGSQAVLGIFRTVLSQPLD